MTKAKIIILLGFLVAFGAGIVTGVVRTQRNHDRDLRPPHEGPPATQPGHDPESRLKRELGLSDEQAEKLKGIWSKAMRDAPRTDPRNDEQRRQWRKERDDAIMALLSEEQKAQYEKIQQSYTQKITEQTELRNKAFQNAVEQTRQILTEEQRKQYDEMLKKRGPGPGGPGPGFEGRGRNRRPDDRQNIRPATGPATTQVGRD